jgi:3-dehydroquinate synthase
VMDTINLDLGSRSYPIYIGRGLLGDPDLLPSMIAGEQVFIVTNETVAPLYREKVEAILKDFQVDGIDLPDGEEFKNLEILNTIFTALLKRRYDRSATLVALGGGVVGDTAGFAAASYLRGIGLIQVPTSLLAQVDSSVGGKTAVNHPAGKNMIGAFYQPNGVVVDLDTLATLPRREYLSGLGEVIKHGCLWDEEFFQWLETHIESILKLESEKLAYLVRRNCEIKSEVVAADETESGIRTLLNLGHTFGHAIETVIGYGQWLHGEAVAVGMIMAADLSARLGMLEVGACRRVKQLVERAGLPCAPPEIAVSKFMDAMQLDKKNRGGRIRFVLLERVGRAVITGDVDEAALKETLQAGSALCDL